MITAIKGRNLLIELHNLIANNKSNNHKRQLDKLKNINSRFFNAFRFRKFASLFKQAEKIATDRDNENYSYNIDNHHPFLHRLHFVEAGLVIIESVKGLLAILRFIPLNIRPMKKTVKIVRTVNIL